MAGGTAAILGGAGALASAFGGSKKQTTSENLSGYQALPKEVQDLLIEQYLPKAQATLDMPYQNIPMQRAQNPAGDPFASQALYDLQMFSDAAGGYFTPYNQGGNGTVDMASYQGAAGAGTAQPMQMQDTGTQVGGDQQNAMIQQYLNSFKGAGGNMTNGKNNQMAYQIEAMLKSGAIKPDAVIKGMGSNDPNALLNIMRGL